MQKLFQSYYIFLRFFYLKISDLTFMNILSSTLAYCISTYHKYPFSFTSFSLILFIFTNLLKLFIFFQKLHDPLIN